MSRGGIICSAICVLSWWRQVVGTAAARSWADRGGGQVLAVIATERMFTRLGIRSCRVVHTRMIRLVFRLLHLEAVVGIRFSPQAVCSGGAVVILVDLAMHHRVGGMRVSISRRSGIVHRGPLSAVGRWIRREVDRLRVVATRHGIDREMVLRMRVRVVRVVVVRMLHAFVVVDVQVLARKGAAR